MSLSVFWGLTTVLAAIGLTSCIARILCAIEKPKRAHCLCLLPVDARCESLEQLLRWQLNTLRWDSWLSGGELVVLDCGVTEEQRRLIASFCDEHAGMRFGAADEMLSLSNETDGAVYKTMRIVLY